MKYVYFIRHGESKSNAGIAGLGSNSSLSEKGVEQSKFIADRCSKLPIQLIISSTMNRAKETAELIASRTCKAIELSDLFVERRHPSEFKGKSEEEFNELRHSIKGFVYKPSFHYSDEENFEDLLVRAQKALQLIKSKREEHIVVVTHGSFLRDMLALAIFQDDLTPSIRRDMTRGMTTKNTGLTLLTYDEPTDQWSMITWNDHAHLG